MNRFASFFDVTNLETSIPQSVSFSSKKSQYTYQTPGSDNYPPHLNMIPENDVTPTLRIFDFMRLADTATLIPAIVPDRILDWLHGKPEHGSTIAQIEELNTKYRSQKKDIFDDPNIGDRSDWYTDAVFAQQQFTGVNPTTIKLAPAIWIDRFKSAARAQSNEEILELLTSADNASLYLQDCSYFRDAVKVASDAPMISEDKTRFLCAAVSLFQLNNAGKLHPLAIIIDYKQSIENSVVIFNKRLDPHSTIPESADWPWRYAKLCTQVSDWMRHEITTHLVNTHFVEEAVIVATHRNIPADHPVFKVLEPHWLKTLSLNAAARATLVPKIIVDLVGLTEKQSYNFINYAYTHFNWEALYIPNDLERRGFPLNQLNSKKFHNYAYGKDISMLWGALQGFVSSMLAISYGDDQQGADQKVAEDSAIQAWSSEMRSSSGGNLASFPVIHTFKELVDAVTMCIHIASPQHTAVNYLQNYYQSFVINRPPALCSAPPTTLDALLAYDEPALMRALPVNRPREWLLASHLPHLLSFRVADDQNLINYAASLWNLYKAKTGPGDIPVKKAAGLFYEQLVALRVQFQEVSDGMDKGTIPYMVLDPDATAVSILI